MEKYKTTDFGLDREFIFRTTKSGITKTCLNSYAKHIYEMGEVQKIYTAVLVGKEPDMAKVTSLTFESEKIVAKRKDELLQFLNECDKEFYDAVNSVKDWQEKVSFFGIEVPKFGVIELLIRYETLHHGQFIAFGYILGTQFPQSWIDLGFT